MKLPPEGARWLISVRWAACAGVVVMTFLAHTVLGVLVNPWPDYAIAGAMVVYNLLFRRYHDRAQWNADADRSMFFQILLDLLALALVSHVHVCPSTAGCISCASSTTKTGLLRVLWMCACQRWRRILAPP